MFFLNLKMSVLIIILFGILYVISSMLLSYGFKITGFLPHIVLAFIMVFIQYLIGPKIVELVMRVKYIKKEDFPWLFDTVEELSRKANIPMPKVAISYVNVPNAFAFGKGVKDGRVCLTNSIISLLNKDELKAVLGHEISHLKNRDIIFITILSVIPLILYNIYRYFAFFGYYRNRHNRTNYSFFIAMGAFILYFITNLLVLYASRIREYFADRGSINLGNSPQVLATSLYKLVYGTVKSSKEEIREIEGIKAFFLNDLSRARNEIRELTELDLDRSGTIDLDELKELKYKQIKLSFTDILMEVLSTHPNMLKRIKQLSYS